jgi:hypothetical protein
VLVASRAQGGPAGGRQIQKVDGRVRYREDIVDGIENCPSAIAELYRGENLGKRLIRLRPE